MKRATLCLAILGLLALGSQAGAVISVVGPGVGVCAGARDTTNVCPQVVHCTDAPRSATLSSSSSYSV